jgi:hypothetical protein
MRAEVATRFVDTMLAKLEVPDMFNEVPDRDVPEMFDAMRLEETIFARLLVPVTFRDDPKRPPAEMLDTVILELNRFARFEVPEIFAVVDLADPVTRFVHSKLRTFDVPKRFIVVPVS